MRGFTRLGRCLGGLLGVGLCLGVCDRDQSLHDDLLVGVDDRHDALDIELELSESTLDELVMELLLSPLKLRSIAQTRRDDILTLELSRSTLESKELEDVEVAQRPHGQRDRRSESDHECHEYL